MEQVTVLVSSCDKYADILDGFAACWKKYWPDCPFPVVLSTESVPEKLNTEFFTECYAEKKDWSERLLTACQKIDSPYILWILDDYFVNRTIDTSLMNEIVDFVKEEDLGLFRMIPSPVPQVKWSKVCAGKIVCGEYQKGQAYRISTQVAIWKKDFLVRLLKDLGPCDPWRFERYGSFLSAQYAESCLGTYEKVFPYTEVLCGGRWINEGWHFCKRENLPMQYAKRDREPLWYYWYRILRGVVFRINPEFFTKAKLLVLARKEKK